MSRRQSIPFQVVQKLLGAVEVPGAEGLQLTEEHAAVILAANKKSGTSDAKTQQRRDKAAPTHLPGALEALRANLVANSPLVQVT